MNPLVIYAAECSTITVVQCVNNSEATTVKESLTSRGYDPIIIYSDGSILGQAFITSTPAAYPVADIDAD